MSSKPDPYRRFDAARGKPGTGLVQRVDELRAALRLLPAERLAERTGSSYETLAPGRGAFRLSLFDSPFLLTYPELRAYNTEEAPCPPHVQALVVYYFHTADGAPLNGSWVSFAELPGGRTYNQAFQGYSGDELARAFGLELGAFQAACEKAGGVKTPSGDAAYIFQALPRLPLLVNYWLGDEDFPSSCKILFDQSVSHYLPTDVCAILGGMLAGRVLAARVKK